MEAALEADADSRLGTYYRVNPTLEKYVPKPQLTLEIERELVTRYRTGSHSLAIELGRYSNTPRENRVCCCGNSVQSVWHLFTECPLTLPLVDHQRYNNLSDVHAFFYKHQRYKHREAQILPKFFDKIDVPMYSASICL